MTENKNKKLYSPCCGAELVKVEDSGESVKACKDCGSSWFLLKCVERKDTRTLKEKIAAKLQESREEKQNSVTPEPRYDDVFWEGMAELDKL